MKVSILIPTYNAVKFISETVHSWLNQTIPVYEIIIQDDCSTDGTWELAKELSIEDSRVKVFRNEKNYGIGKNWNLAYENSSGDYIVIFNADDLVENNFLEVSRELFNKYETIDYVSHAYYNTNEENVKNELTLHFSSHNGFINNIFDFEKQVKIKPHWNYTLITKSSLDSLKTNGQLFYNTQVCDAMLWCELFRKNLIGYFSGQLLGYYRLHNDNNSKIPLGEFESTILDMLPIYHHELNLIHESNFFSPIKTIINYLYQTFKYKKSIKIRVIKNIIKYSYFKKV